MEKALTFPDGWDEWVAEGTALGARLCRIEKTIQHSATADGVSSDTRYGAYLHFPEERKCAGGCYKTTPQDAMAACLVDARVLLGVDETLEATPADATR